MTVNGSYSLLTETTLFPYLFIYRRTAVACLQAPDSPALYEHVAFLIFPPPWVWNQHEVYWLTSTEDKVLVLDQADDPFDMNSHVSNAPSLFYFYPTQLLFPFGKSRYFHCSTVESYGFLYVEASVSQYHVAWD